MGGSNESTTVGTQPNLAGDGQTGRSGSPKGWKALKENGWEALKENGWRVAFFLLGSAVAILGLVFWLAPALNGVTTAEQETNTKVTDSVGRTTTTEVKSNTTTTTPGAGKSDAMFVAVFTVGVGLAATAAMWHRIGEFTFGGVSIKLAETAVGVQEIALVDATVAAHVDSVVSTAVESLIDGVRTITREQKLAYVDLKAGKLWAPTNLSLYILLLASHSEIEVVIFIGQRDADSQRYFGAAPVGRLADRVKADNPTLAGAYSAADKSRLKSRVDAHNLALALDGAGVLLSTDDRVDQIWLERWAGKVLITLPVEVDVGQALSKQQRQGIFDFPLHFVPITNRHYHLEMVIDKRLITVKK